MTDLTEWTHADVAELARTQTEIHGELPLSVCQRLLADVLPPESATSAVRWRLSAFQRTSTGQSRPSAWMQLQADTDVHVTCQSCLEPMAVALHVDRLFRFVATEEEALLEDEESEEDVLSEPHDVDLFALVEDELLLALPLVPRHGGCIAAYQDAEPAELVEEKPNPFAALAALKKPH